MVTGEREKAKMLRLNNLQYNICMEVVRKYVLKKF
jgi:hypothetical protein